jgi:hypothetical protein
LGKRVFGPDLIDPADSYPEEGLTVSVMEQASAIAKNYILTRSTLQTPHWVPFECYANFAIAEQIQRDYPPGAEDINQLLLGAGVSARFTNFILNLLIVDPYARPTAEQALQVLSVI